MSESSGEPVSRLPLLLLLPPNRMRPPPCTSVAPPATAAVTAAARPAESASRSKSFDVTMIEADRLDRLPSYTTSAELRALIARDAVLPEVPSRSIEVEAPSASAATPVSSAFSSLMLSADAFTMRS